MKVKRTPFSCGRGQALIRGFEYRCEETNRIPVIMSHAFLSNQRIMKKYAEALAKEGYVVLTYDFRGGALFGKSSGSFSDMSIDTEKEDLKSVIAYAEQLSYVDINKLILLGASQGGFVSCLVCAEYQERISKLILLYPALCIPDNAREGKMLMIKFDPEHIDETFTSRPFRFSPKYPKSALHIDVYRELKKIKIPILMIHGDADKIVDVRYAKRAMEEAVNEASDLIILEKAGHGFHKNQYREAIGHIIKYLKATKA